VNEECIPEQRDRHYGGGLGKPCTNPVEKGNPFCHQHLRFGLPALPLVGALKAMGDVHCLVCLVSQIIEICMQFPEHSACERLGRQLGQ
jgi:hypothetical protein